MSCVPQNNLANKTLHLTPLILIVDDDPAVVGSLSFMLEAEGYATRSYGDVPTLLSDEIIQPHCLILDFCMPVMNGLDVLRCLRERLIKAPAILITGRFDTTLRKKALESGFAAVVEKPLLGKILADEVRHLVNMSEAASPPASSLPEIRKTT